MTLKITEEGRTALVGIRRFAASPERVFDAHTRPALISRWMTGPDGWTMPVCEFDATPGGKLRFGWAQGDEAFGFGGTVLDILRPHRIVHTEIWEGADMVGTRNVTSFEADGDGTLMVIQIFYATPEARAAALASGMADGMEMSYARIDGLQD